MDKIGNILIIITLSVCFSCDKKDEKQLLKGNITGMLLLEDIDGFNQNKSGISLTIENERTSKQTTTNLNGEYEFKDVSYGNYNLSFLKEGYFSKTNIVINHVGGFSPTIQDFTLYEIPKYEIHLDSINFDPVYSELFFYGSISGASKMPMHGIYCFRCFGSETSDVSKDTFKDLACGNSISLKDGLIIGRVAYHLFNSSRYNTLHFRVYPEVLGQCYSATYKEFLGKPSNVIKYVFKKP